MFKFLFWAICAIWAAYFVNKQIQKYYENLDKPIMSFKKFNSSPRDKYPTYTICFENMDKSNCDKKFENARKEIQKVKIDECKKKFSGRLLNEEYLQQHQNLSRYDYEDFLHGRNNTNSTILQHNIMEDISFEKASKSINNLISSYTLTNMKGFSHKFPNCYGNINFTSDEEISRTTSNNCPFYKSYQDSDRICLTRDENYMSQGTYSSEIVDLERLELKFAVFIHYPGQGMRTFFKRFLMKEVFSAVLSPTAKLRLPTNAMFQLSGIKLLRKRTDGNDHCKQDSFDDNRIFEQIINQSACIPPYWKKFKSLDLDIENCNDSTMLASLRERTNDAVKWKREQIVGNLPVPCQQMSYGINMEREGSPSEEPFQLRFVYLDEHYLEIQNERDFGWDMCWANIGGYVGLFLGISLLHVTELLSGDLLIWSKATKEKVIRKNTT